MLNIVDLSAFAILIVQKCTPNIRQKDLAEPSWCHLSFFAVLWLPFCHLHHLLLPATLKLKIGEAIRVESILGWRQRIPENTTFCTYLGTCAWKCVSHQFLRAHLVVCKRERECNMLGRGHGRLHARSRFLWTAALYLP